MPRLTGRSAEEAFTYNGVWWLPQSPQGRLAGALAFSPKDGATLDIIGTLNPNPGSQVVWFTPDIVLGVTTDGRKVTLYKCQETQQRFSSGVPAEELRVEFIIIGGHLATPDAIRFHSVQVNYSYLDEWANASGFTIQHDSSRDALIVQHVSPPPVHCTVSSDLLVTFETQIAGPSITFPLLNVEMRQKTFAIFRQSSEVRLEQFIDQMFRLQQFLTLGVTLPAFPLEVYGLTEQVTVNINGAHHSRPLQLFYQSVGENAEPEQLRPQQMLFNLGDIKDNIGTMLANWYSRSQTLEPTYNLYFGVLNSERMYLESKFLTLVQALESYHRRTMNKTELSRDEHRARVRAIICAVPKEQRKWLREKLAYSNELTLKRSMADLRNKLNDAVADLFSDEAINRIVDTRNYLTHYDVRLVKRAAVDPKDLYSLFERLRIVVEACLLYELGLSVETIRGLLKRTSHYPSTTLV